jgi:hypothetical protein
MKRVLWLLVLWGCQAQQVVPGEVFDCTSDRECAAGYVCTEQVCVEGARDLCTTNEDCPEHTVCWLNGDAGICGPVAEGRCNNAAGDAHCADRAVCRRGQCYGPCVDDRGCGADLQCLLGQCEPAEGCGDGAQCAPGRQCVDNRCEAICRGDAECASNEICDAGACVVGCRDHGGCPVDQICRDGRCDAGCRTDEQCPLSERCVDGGCGAECFEHADCGDGLCLEGICGDARCDSGCCDLDGVPWPDARDCFVVDRLECSAACGATYQKYYFDGTCQPNGGCEIHGELIHAEHDCGAEVCDPDASYPLQCVPRAALEACSSDGRGDPPIIDCQADDDWRVCNDGGGHAARCMRGQCRSYACTSTTCNDDGFGYVFSASIPDRIQVIGQGWFRDQQTGLEWLMQVPESATYAGAHDWCTAQGVRGGQVWHVPTFHELITIAKYSPTLQNQLASIVVGGDFYWTRTISSPADALTVKLSTGAAESADRETVHPVICVRGPENARNAAERWGAFQAAMGQDPWTGLAWTGLVAANNNENYRADGLGRGCLAGRFPSVVEAASLISWHGEEGTPLPRQRIEAIGLWTVDENAAMARWAVDFRTGAISAHQPGDPTPYNVTCILN